MPFATTDRLERVRLVASRLDGLCSVAEPAARFRVSRFTVYKRVRHYRGGARCSPTGAVTHPLPTANAALPGYFGPATIGLSASRFPGR